MPEEPQRRTGLLARKLGMSQVFTDAGMRVPVTALQVAPCFVVLSRSLERDGYLSVQIGSGAVRPGKVGKPRQGHFAKAKVSPCRMLSEFVVDAENVLPQGSVLTAAHFSAGQFVDVVGISIGKGFAGVMKRHNFKGMRASHGVSASHRAHGSTGNCQDPGRVLKGKKMAGHMGAERVQQQNLLVFSSDATKELLLVKGSVPGCKGGWLKVFDSRKRPFVPVGDSTPGNAAARA